MGFTSGKAVGGGGGGRSARKPLLSRKGPGESGGALLCLLEASSLCSAWLGVETGCEFEERGGWPAEGASAPGRSAGAVTLYMR